MRRIHLATASILAALAPALAAGPAAADTITRTFSVDHSGPDFVSNVTVLVGSFDANLGTLTSESFSLAGTFTSGFVWQTDPADVPFPASVPVTLTGHVGLLSAKGALALPSEDLAASYGAGYTASGTAQPFSLTNTANPSDPDFNLAQIDVFAWDTTAPLPFPYATGLVDFWTLDSTLTVTYSYTPAALPEPATLPLLLVGLIGLGALTRNRS